ncbi:MAG: response regulator [Rhizobiaceae bacterium]|nr:response regulator [Hyphomicrobiales bacterium]NRB28958.1 response regulator [Rhizobiaceae bacterium]
MTEKPHIIVIEDETTLAGVIKDYLVDAEMKVTLLHDGTAAVQTILGVQPDLVVLDIMLPGKDGITICREVRAQSEVPIIMETAKVDEIDRLLGLELGADDYLCKPFSPRELVARVKAVLRRTRAVGSNDAPDTSGSDRLQLDEEKWLTRLDGTSINLTRREFQLLLVLQKSSGRVYSRAQLLDAVFHDDADVFDRTIDSHIKNLRQKLKQVASDFDPIRSVYGVGYAYEP